MLTKVGLIVGGFYFEPRLNKRAHNLIVIRQHVKGRKLSGDGGSIIKRRTSLIALYLTFSI